MRQLGRTQRQLDGLHRELGDTTKNLLLKTALSKQCLSDRLTTILRADWWSQQRQAGGTCGERIGGLAYWRMRAVIQEQVVDDGGMFNV